MDPTIRKMLQVQPGEADDAEEAFTVLMGDTVAPRKQFIEQNAHLVDRLDI